MGFCTVPSLQAQTKSNISFTIKNAGLNVEGIFSDFKSNIQFDAKAIENTVFSGEIAVSSINTGINMRDNHLMKEEYFHQTKFPSILFKSNAVKLIKEGQLEVLGTITIKGITKPIKLLVNYSYSKTNTIFRTTIKLNRRDFKVGGSSWMMSDLLEANIVIVK